MQISIWLGYVRIAEVLFGAGGGIIDRLAAGRPRGCGSRHCYTRARHPGTERSSSIRETQTEDAVRLIGRHPLRTYWAIGQHDSDAIAVALAGKPRLTVVQFERSDLTDHGFRALPLEQLQVIEIEGGQLTEQGLADLHRCRHLTSLTMDAALFTEPVAEALTGLTQLEWLQLSGPNLTDDSVPLLGTLKQVRYMYLLQTKVTDKGLQALGASLRDCVIANEPPL